MSGQPRQQLQDDSRVIERAKGHSNDSYAVQKARSQFKGRYVREAHSSDDESGTAVSPDSAIARQYAQPVHRLNSLPHNWSPHFTVVSSRPLDIRALREEESFDSSYDSTKEYIDIRHYPVTDDVSVDDSDVTATDYAEEQYYPAVSDYIYSCKGTVKRVKACFRALLIHTTPFPSIFERDRLVGLTFEKALGQRHDPAFYERMKERHDPYFSDETYKFSGIVEQVHHELRRQALLLIKHGQYGINPRGDQEDIRKLVAKLRRNSTFLCIDGNGKTLFRHPALRLLFVFTFSTDLGSNEGQFERYAKQHPAPILALLATALQYALDCWSEGREKLLKHFFEKYHGVYDKYLMVLQKIQRENPSYYHHVMEWLYYGEKKEAVATKSNVETVRPLEQQVDKPKKTEAPHGAQPQALHAQPARPGHNSGRDASHLTGPTVANAEVPHDRQHLVNYINVWTKQQEAAAKESQQAKREGNTSASQRPNLMQETKKDPPANPLEKKTIAAPQPHPRMALSSQPKADPQPVPARPSAAKAPKPIQTKSTPQNHLSGPPVHESKAERSRSDPAAPVPVPAAFTSQPQSDSQKPTPAPLPITRRAADASDDANPPITTAAAPKTATKAQAPLEASAAQAKATSRGSEAPPPHAPAKSGDGAKAQTDTPPPPVREALVAQQAWSTRAPLAEPASDAEPVEVPADADAEAPVAADKPQPTGKEKKLKPRKMPSDTTRQTRSAARAQSRVESGEKGEKGENGKDAVMEGPALPGVGVRMTRSGRVIKAPRGRA